MFWRMYSQSHALCVCVCVASFVCMRCESASVCVRNRENSRAHKIVLCVCIKNLFYFVESFSCDAVRIRIARASTRVASAATSPLHTTSSLFRVCLRSFGAMCSAEFIRISFFIENKIHSAPAARIKHGCSLAHIHSTHTYTHKRARARIHTQTHIQ